MLWQHVVLCEIVLLGMCPAMVCVVCYVAGYIPSNTILHNTVSINLLSIQQPDYIYIYIYIQGVTGGTDQTSGGCSLC